MGKNEGWKSLFALILIGVSLYFIYSTVKGEPTRSEEIKEEQKLEDEEETEEKEEDVWSTDNRGGGGKYR